MLLVTLFAPAAELSAAAALGALYYFALAHQVCLLSPSPLADTHLALLWFKK
jgi:hypothetical protein